MKHCDLKDQFLNLDLKFEKSNHDIEHITPAYLSHCFSYLDVYFAHVDKTEKSLALFIDDTLNSTILILYCWFCGYKLVAIDESEDDEVISGKLNLFPHCEVARGEEISIPEYNGPDIKRIYEIPIVSLTEDFLVTFTSGSTGVPKAVVHSRGNIIKCSTAYNSVFATSTSKRNFLHVMPKYYMAGLFNALLLPISIKASVTILPAFNSITALRFFEMISRHSITDVWLSPSMLSLVNSLDRTYRGLKQPLAVYLCTGPANENECKVFENKFNISPLIGYGLSETLFVSFTLKGASDYKTIGHCIPGVVVEQESDGPARITSPFLALKYIRKEREEQLLNPFITSDKLKISDDGNISFQGRTDDMVIRGGINVNPNIYENILLRKFSLSNICILGLPDERLGEKLVLVSQEDLTNQHSRIKFEFKRINSKVDLDMFCVVDHFPVGPTGKIQRAQLKRMLSDD